jgi:hypothetical protein
MQGITPMEVARAVVDFPPSCGHYYFTLTVQMICEYNGASCAHLYSILILRPKENGQKKT